MNYKQTTTEMTSTGDMTFEDYNSKARYEISTERNNERALCTKPAGNFIFNDNKWLPQEYEGFGIISMLNENEGNEPLAARLIEIQNELRYNLTPRYAFYQLPPESFHQTVANTLSNERFKENIADAGLEDAYPSMVANTFDNLSEVDSAEPIRMKMAGLSIFGTAIGMLGIFENEDDYIRMVNFRSGFYNDDQLAQLDVKMTRPFIGHITLTYIEQSLNKNQKDHLAKVTNEINRTLAAEENYFFISVTGLRRYHHLAEFIKQDNYPVYQL